MESVSFDTLTFDHPAAARPARVSATLHLPMQADRAFPAMVILTSSAGVQRHREHYYAQTLNEAGVAALIVDSFTGRGVRRTVADLLDNVLLFVFQARGQCSPNSFKSCSRNLTKRASLRLRGRGRSMSISRVRPPFSLGRMRTRSAR